VQKTTAALGRKQQLKQNVRHVLHRVATACSSVSSDITEYVFSKDGFGIVNFCKNMKDETGEEKGAKSSGHFHRVC
jgi:hypothetical protein